MSAQKDMDIRVKKRTGKKRYPTYPRSIEIQDQANLYTRETEPTLIILLLLAPIESGIKAERYLRVKIEDFLVFLKRLTSFREMMIIIGKQEALRRHMLFQNVIGHSRICRDFGMVFTGEPIGLAPQRPLNI